MSDCVVLNWPLIVGLLVLAAPREVASAIARFNELRSAALTGSGGEKKQDQSSTDSNS